MPLKYGKYANRDLRDVPTEYLEWILEIQDSSGREIETELQRRRLAEEADHSWVERIVNTGYRSLAKEHHPDMGGDPETMKELNSAVAVLRGLIGRNGGGSE